jgi:hypothetical protein
MLLDLHAYPRGEQKKSSHFPTPSFASGKIAPENDPEHDAHSRAGQFATNLGRQIPSDTANAQFITRPLQFTHLLFFPAPKTNPN